MTTKPGGDAGAVAVSKLDAGTLAVLPEGVLALAPDGSVVAVSDRCRTLLGLGPADAVTGRPVDDVVTLLSDGGDRCPLSSWLQGAGDRLAEQYLTVPLPDGRKRPLAMAGTRLDGGGLLLTFRHAGRRQQLDRLRSELVATVSHEIRSPLTSVKGFTKTMLGKWERFSDAQKRVMLETINEDADRVTRLLTELLDVSRIDAGRVQLRRQLVDLGAAATGIVERARVKPHAEDREVALNVEPTREVLADPDKIEQVLTNLVENALLHGDGTVTVSVGPHGGEAVRVTVADEGPGIADDQLRRIFEKFGRGRDVRRSGTGLGLYITRGLVQAHGGAIEVSSVLGEGTTFSFSLPVGEPV